MRAPHWPIGSRSMVLRSDGELRGGKASGSDVSEEHDRFVTERSGNRRQIGLRVGHENIVGLAAIDRVAQPPATTGHPMAIIAGAQGILALETIEADAARRNGADQH